MLLLDWEMDRVLRERWSCERMKCSLSTFSIRRNKYCCIELKITWTIRLAKIHMSSSASISTPVLFNTSMTASSLIWTALLRVLWLKSVGIKIKRKRLTSTSANSNKPSFSVFQASKICQHRWRNLLALPSLFPIVSHFRL